jgi:LmbE family N-acetylglucosaminyl deacetylase
MKINILSPHIDDAAYSLALTISKCAMSKMEITIINCFTVTNWALRFVSKNVKEISDLRKKEDVEFYNNYNVPVRIVNLDLLDAPLRNGFIFQEKSFEETEWKMVEYLKNYLEKNCDGILFCPLGIGDHIDHAICLETVVQLYKKMDVLFFEDLPYASRISEGEITDLLKNIEERLMVKLHCDISTSNNCLFDKEAIIRLYKTQINDEICAEIIDYMNAVSGERFWGETEVIAQLNKSYVSDQNVLKKNF